MENASRVFNSKKRLHINTDYVLIYGIYGQITGGLQAGAEVAAKFAFMGLRLSSANRCYEAEAYLVHTNNVLVC